MDLKTRSVNGNYNSHAGQILFCFIYVFIYFTAGLRTLTDTLAVRAVFDSTLDCHPRSDTCCTFDRNTKCFLVYLLAAHFGPGDVREVQVRHWNVLFAQSQVMVQLGSAVCEQRRIWGAHFE